jgi:hypothetical protein
MYSSQCTGKGEVMILAKEFEGELWIKAAHHNLEVKRAVDAEREACANLLLSTDLSGLRNDLVLQNWTANLLANYAAAIRARGQI